MPKKTTKTLRAGSIVSRKTTTARVTRGNRPARKGRYDPISDSNGDGYSDSERKTVVHIGPITVNGHAVNQINI